MRGQCRGSPWRPGLGETRRHARGGECRVTGLRGAARNIQYLHFSLLGKHLLIISYYVNYKGITSQYLLTININNYQYLLTIDIVKLRQWSGKDRKGSLRRKALKLKPLPLNHLPLLN